METSTDRDTQKYFEGKLGGGGITEKIYTYMYFPGIKNFTYLLNCKYNDDMLLGTKIFDEAKLILFALLCL